MGFPLTTVALVGFREEDEISIQKIFHHEERVLVPDCTWKVRTAKRVDTALKDFQREPVPVAMCDHDRTHEKPRQSTEGQIWAVQAAGVRW